MRRRICLWALIGFAVAMFWFVVGLFTWPNYNLGRSLFVAITAPASLIGRTMPLAYYWFILLNASIYALVGLTTELLLPAFHSRRALIGLTFGFLRGPCG